MEAGAIDAREYFDAVARAAAELRAAQLVVEFGPVRGDGCGRSDPSSGGPTAAQAAAVIEAQRRVDACTDTIGDALALITGLRMVYSRKADVLELHYVDRLSWPDVGAELGVSDRTAKRWRDELCDWVDAVGFARARAGVGIAAD